MASPDAATTADVSLVESLLKQPESKTLEFKRDASSIKPILRTLVAFANTSGGHLVIGRDDAGRITGVSDPLADELRLANAVASGVVPAILPDIDLVSVDGAPLVIVYVPRWRGPAFVKAEGADKGVYVRLGSTTRRADAGLLAELRREMEGIFYDAMPCERATPESLDKERLAAFADAVGQPLGDALLRNLEILVDTPRGLRPSNGGLVLFATDPERDRLIHETWIQAARFADTGKATFLDRKQLEGSPLDVLDEAARFIARNTRLAARIGGAIRRTNIPEYPPGAVREALVNAIAHRDYSMTDMSIRLAIFSDRLEIESPGTLPHGMTVDQLKGGMSRPRNRVIARILRELDIMEAWGSGYRRMREDCEKLGHPLPEWHEVGPVVRTIFQPHPEAVDRQVSDGREHAADVPVNVPVNVPESVPAGIGLSRRDWLALSRRQRWVLARLAAGDHVRRREIEVEWGVVDKTAKRDLKALQEKGLIEYVGPPKTGEWRLTGG